MNVLNYLTTSPGRLRITDGAVVQATRYHYSDYIPVCHGMTVIRNFSVGSESYGDVYYDVYRNVIETVPGKNATKVHAVPAGAAFARFTIPDSMLEPGEETAEIRAERTGIIERTRWLAIGDSITFGVYSEAVNGGTVKYVGNGWVRQLADALGYDLKVMASRGMGYSYAVTGKDPDHPGARICLDTLLDRVEELEGDYNLVTVAFGVNDYNTPETATLDTVEAGLRSALRRLTARFIGARIAVITPLNCCNAPGCTAETKWNCNFPRAGRTLADIARRIEEVCGAYGVECINCTENFLFNTANIDPSLDNSVRLLPDKVHPSLAAHTLIAKAMARYLIF